jgi:hypothetical protein
MEIFAEFKNYRLIVLGRHIKYNSKMSLTVHTYNPSTQQAEAGGTGGSGGS